MTALGWISLVIGATLGSLVGNLLAGWVERRRAKGAQTFGRRHDDVTRPMVFGLDPAKAGSDETIEYEVTTIHDRARRYEPGILRNVLRGG